MRLDTQYNDIINFSHHVSSKHQRMSISDRAAQFSPFAALAGHEAAIKETERITDERIELDEDRKRILDEKLRLILEQRESRTEIGILYFISDEKKDGGAYVNYTGQLKKVDEYEKVLVMMDGTRIRIDQIYEID